MRPLSAVLAALFPALSAAAVPTPPAPYLDPARPPAARVHDLLSRLTLGEKAGLMKNASNGVPRLGIPKYGWWNEGLHGVARAGVHPRAIESVAAFRRRHLAAGAHRTVRLRVAPASLRRWSNPQKAMITSAGEWRVLVGASSADIRQHATVRLD